MISVSELKKGTVITLEGAHWIVEDYHIQKTAQRKPVLQVRLRNMRSGQVVERSFHETDRVEAPEVATRQFQFLYEDPIGYVFMDTETYDQISVPPAIVGKGKWLLKEGAEFPIRLVEGQPFQVVFPPTFVDEVVETGAGSGSGHASNVLKDARLACGLEIKVPQFISVGDLVRIDTETHKYLGKETPKR